MLKNHLNGRDDDDGKTIGARALLSLDKDKQSTAPSEVAPSSPLDERLRGTSSGFEFDALLKGVSTLPEAPERPFLQAPTTDADITSDVPHPPALPDVPAVASPPATRQPVRSYGVLARPSVLAAMLTAVLAAILSAVYLNRPDTVAAPSPATTIVDVRNEWVKRGLPDPALSPGEHTGRGLRSFTKANTQVIPAKVQRTVLKAYGIRSDDKRFVVCYVIPPTLGGTSAVKNLFPTTPWFSNLKSRLDLHLVEMVKGGKLSVAKARQEETTNWVKAVHRYSVRNYGQTSRSKAQQVEDKIRWGN